MEVSLSLARTLMTPTGEAPTPSGETVNRAADTASGFRTAVDGRLVPQRGFGPSGLAVSARLPLEAD